MPKVKSDIMQDENFAKFYKAKFNEELFNEYGENLNTLTFKADTKNLKISIRSDIAKIICNRLKVQSMQDGNHRKSAKLSLSKCGDDETLREFFNLTRLELNETTQVLFWDNGQVNFNLLRYDNIHSDNSKDRITVTYKGVYLQADIERWANALNALLSKCQKLCLKPVEEIFNGRIEIKNISTIQYSGATNQ